MLEFNGRNLKIELTYNTMVELEDMGVSLVDADKSPLKLLRAILFISLKKIVPAIKIEEVGEEINKYIENGGSIEAISNAFQEAVEKSGFFPKNNR